MLLRYSALLMRHFAYNKLLLHVSYLCSELYCIIDMKHRLNKHNHIPSIFQIVSLQENNSQLQAKQKKRKLKYLINKVLEPKSIKKLALQFCKFIYIVQ